MASDARCLPSSLSGLLTLLSFGTSADAGIVIPLADEDLIAGADVIVLGRVTRITSHADLFGEISTYITLSLAYYSTRRKTPMADARPRDPPAA